MQKRVLLWYRLEAYLMKKVCIEPGCIGCGLCQALVPAVFEVKNSKSEVKADADLKAFAEKIKASAQLCPVQVIVYEE